MMSGPEVAFVCEEARVAALLPLSPRGARRLEQALLAEAGLLYKEGLVPLVPAGVMLALVTDRESARLNSQALGSFGPTNILSFPGREGEEASLALAVETLLRESVLYGQEPVSYLTRLLAHGTAHVCGLDHSPEMDAVQERLERAGLACLEAAAAAGAPAGEEEEEN